MSVLTAILFGLITGSFLNVCIVRLPRGESIVTPRSHCVTCGKLIAWFDNIPVLSFLWLRGQCRHCGSKISVQYPAIEIFSAILFVVMYEFFGFSVEAGVFLLLSLALLTQAAIDYNHQIIPDEITLPGILFGLVFSMLFPQLQNESVWYRGGVAAIAGILAGGGVLYLAGTVTERILKKEAMGGGDVKLLAMIGAFLGWRGVIWTLFVASLIGSIVGIYLRFKEGQERIPFGPYLAMGAFLYLFIGRYAMDAYFNYIHLR